jgi:hypothetical protein
MLPYFFCCYNLFCVAVYTGTGTVQCTHVFTFMYSVDPSFSPQVDSSQLGSSSPRLQCHSKNFTSDTTYSYIEPVSTIWFSVEDIILLRQRTKDSDVATDDRKSFLICGNYCRNFLRTGNFGR